MFRRLDHRNPGALHARAAALVCAALAVLVLGGSSVARAGGFGISVTLPAPEVREREKDAVLVLTAAGCHGPGATISATAEGLVNGQRRSIKLTLTPLPSLAVGENNALNFPRYAMKRQWLAEGTWVLALNATAAPRTFNNKTIRVQSHVLLPLGPNGSLENLPTYPVSAPPGVRVEAWQRSLRVQHMFGSPAEEAKTLNALLTKTAKGPLTTAAASNVNRVAP